MTITFTRTETQTAISDMITGVLASTYDFKARHDAIAVGGHSPAIWATLAEQGVLGIEVSEAVGGIGGTFADTAVVLEALGAALVVEPFVPTAVLGVGLLNELGAPEMAAPLLEQIVAGTLKLALAHDEASGAKHLTSVKREGEGWRLNGAKTRVLGGDVADLLLVSALTDQGVSMFMVPAETAGLSRRAYRMYDEHGAADIAMDVFLPADALLGELGAASPAIELALDRGAAAAIHQAIGAMERLCSMTPDYLKARVQFGKPLASFQVLQHRMVDMAMALEQARSMAMLATAALDEADPVIRACDISAAKIYTGDAARLVGQTAVQLHGGIALTDEYPAGHYFKRLTMLARQFGDELHHLDRYMELAA
jgi:alkylation response protein AidB-like acyl-CoA dehydrogenase